MTPCSSSHRMHAYLFAASALVIGALLLSQLGFVDALPDLQLSQGQVNLEDSSVYVGDMVFVNVTVINIGSADLKNVTVGVYDMDPGRSGKLLCPEKRVDVGAYNFTWVNFTFKAKEEHRKIRAIWVVADREDAFDELNEKNNAATSPMRVVVRESLVFVLKVVGQGLFLTFFSLSLLALVLYIVGKFINRFFAERPQEAREGPEMKREVFTEERTSDSEGRVKEEVAAAAAAVAAFRRGV